MTNKSKLIPVMKNLQPGIMAKEILEVQQMNVPTRWATGYEEHREDLPLRYWVEVPFKAELLLSKRSQDADAPTIRNVTRWCEETFEPGTWTAKGLRVLLKEERQATALLLRWS